jgi:hypothetical protein
MCLVRRYSTTHSTVQVSMVGRAGDNGGRVARGISSIWRTTMDPVAEQLQTATVCAYSIVCSTEAVLRTALYSVQPWCRSEGSAVLSWREDYSGKATGDLGPS